MVFRMMQCTCMSGGLHWKKKRAQNFIQFQCAITQQKYTGYTINT